MNTKQKSYLISIAYILCSSLALALAVISIQTLLKIISFLITSNYIDTFTQYTPARLVFILIIGILIKYCIIYFLVHIGLSFFNLTKNKVKEWI